MTEHEKCQLRFIEDKLIDVMAIHGHTADIKMIGRLSMIQQMLGGLRTVDEVSITEIGE